MELEEKSRILANAARRRLISFCETINPSWETVWFHEHIADILQDAYEKVQRKEKVRIILSIPPRHGKTQLASIYFPAWALGNDPNLRFILSTYGSDLSEVNGRKTRDIIASDAYGALFPNISLREDQKAKAKWVVSNREEDGTFKKEAGSYTAVGIGGAVTGIGGDVIIIDDPHKDRAEAESETMRENVWEYYKSTLYSRLEGHGAVIVIMQRWHDDDLVGRLLRDAEEKKAAGEPYDEWTEIKFPAIAEESDTVNGHTMRQVGEPLWPSKFPLEVLNNIRSNADPYNWASQYMQSPINRETQEFKESWFQYYDPMTLNGRYLRYHTIVDPAISQKKDADNTVVLTIAKEVNGPNFYRVREDAGKFTPSQTVELIFQHQTEYRSDVSIEMVQYQQALKYAVLEEQRKRQQYFVVKELKANADKRMRIRGLIPLYQAGVVYHLRTDREYERELLSFPGGKHDDRIDAMAYLQQAAYNTTTGPKTVKSSFKGYFAKR